MKERNDPFVFDEPEYTHFPLASSEKPKAQNFPNYSTTIPTPVKYEDAKPKNSWYSYLGGDLVSDEDLNLFVDSFARENALWGNQNILYSKKEKPNFIPNPNKRKGSENRQPSGSRELNVRHPDGEEHSRVPKGSGGRPHNNIRRSEIDEEVLSKILGGAAAAGTGYLIYRGARMLPSLLPPLWATIPANIIAP